MKGLLDREVIWAFAPINAHFGLFIDTNTLEPVSLMSELRVPHLSEVPEIIIK